MDYQKQLLADSDSEDFTAKKPAAAVFSFVDKRDLLAEIDNRGGLSLVNTTHKLLELIQKEQPHRFGGEKKKAVKNFVDKYKRSTAQKRHRFQKYINLQAELEESLNLQAEAEESQAEESQAETVGPLEQPLLIEKMSSFRTPTRGTRGNFCSPSSGGNFRSPSQKKNANSTEGKFLLGDSDVLLLSVQFHG